jgi:hypothetical protein
MIKNREDPIHGCGKPISQCNREGCEDRATVSQIRRDALLDAERAVARAVELVDVPMSLKRRVQIYDAVRIAVRELYLGDQSHGSAVAPELRGERDQARSDLAAERALTAELGRKLSIARKTLLAIGDETTGLDSSGMARKATDALDDIERV